ncbi:MAG: hypothetical protein ACI4XN_12485 [Candidatus Kurthia intestinigallinarum]
MTFDVNKVDDDIICMKRKIKQMLIADPDILEALHNTDIPLDSPDEFLDANIYGFIRIPQTQDTVRNFICFTVDDIEDAQFNTHMKIQQMQFNCICHLDDMKTEYGIDRHDLLGFLVRRRINWTNDFGTQFKLVYNKESTIDSDYYCRTLKFERECTNSLNKAVRSNPYDKSRAR